MAPLPSGAGRVPLDNPPTQTGEGSEFTFYSVPTCGGAVRRKIELTRELVDHHARCREEGVPIPEACRLAGHGVSVFYRWVREAEEWRLLKRMKEAGLFDEEWLMQDPEWRALVEAEEAV